jgi:TolA-binding protein
MAPSPAPAAAHARPARRHVADAHPAAPAPALAPAPAPAPTDLLAREVPLIDAARSDVATSPSRALAALETHRREFPHGQLAAEREFLTVQALLQMNRMADAKQRAAELASRHPTSSYAARAAKLIQDVEAQRAATPGHDSSREKTTRPAGQPGNDRL